MAKLRVPLDTTLFGFDARALQAGLSAAIVGQDEAVAAIVDVYQMFLTGLNSPDRPVGAFLFLGPTGTGKTRTVEAAAETLLGNAHAVVKVDCGEFQHSHEIAKLIGSPPGYVGHRETQPILSQETLDRAYTDRLKLSLVLFDEIEKASDALWNLLLGILDKATLTLGDGRKVDFSRSMIFLTSNLGAAGISALMRPGMGFTTGPAADEGKIAATAVDAARRRFTPEFINRIDKIIVFRSLGEPELRKIVDIELARLQKRLPFTLALDDRARAHLLAEGTDPAYGARHLKRAIDRILLHPLAGLMATNQIRDNDTVDVEFDSAARRLLFFRAPRARTATASPLPAAA